MKKKRITISLKTIILMVLMIILIIVLGSYYLIAPINSNQNSDDIIINLELSNNLNQLSKNLLISMSWVLFGVSQQPIESLKESKKNFSLIENLLTTIDNLLEKNNKSKNELKDIINEYKNNILIYIDTTTKILEYSHKKNILQIEYNKLSENVYNDLSKLHNILVKKSAKMINTNTQTRLAILNTKILVYDTIRLINKVDNTFSEAMKKYNENNILKAKNGLNGLKVYAERILSTVNILKEKELINSSIENINKLLVLPEEATKILTNYNVTYNKMKETINIINKIDTQLQLKVTENTLKSAKDISFVIDSNKYTTITLILTLTIASIGIITYLKLRISNPIKKFTESISDISAKNNDLTQRIQLNYNNEVSDLGRNLNKFIGSIQDIIIKIKISTEDTTLNNNQLSKAIEELDSTFDSQTKQISDVMTQIENINKSSKTRNDDINNTVKVLSNSTKSVQESKDQLYNVKSDIQDIKIRTESLSMTINKLSEQSQLIEEILIVINDIAEQTNLLALNAAIEAARAGESGRGFAVVADEVRKLAERTQKATGEIEKIILSLKSEAENASNEMVLAGKSVEQGTKSILNTTVNFDNIVKDITQIFEKTTNIENFSSEQFNAILNVENSIKNIASDIKKYNLVVNDISSTVINLEERAKKLKTLIEPFKT